MTTSWKTSLVIGLVLAFAGGPYATFAAEASDASDALRPTPKQAFDDAKALAPAFRLPAAPEARGIETDGLGRTDEDCKLGCTDH